jgi:hypothetical protein
MKVRPALLIVVLVSVFAWLSPQPPFSLRLPLGLFWSPLTVHAQRSVTPVLPCLDPRGCPDLSVDRDKLHQWHVEIRDFDPTDCPVVEGCNPAGTRTLLRFTSNTPTLGAGDLIVGNPREHPELFRQSECHGHLHFEEYADYRLWTPAGYAEWQALRAADPDALAADLLKKIKHLDRKMVAGRKQGFCVIDLLPAASPSCTPPPPKYFPCSTNQGISVCYADEYHFLLDCQWMDVTGLPAGPYVLEDEVNAERLFAESNYRNNASAIEVELPARPGRATADASAQSAPHGCAKCSDQPVPARATARQ